MSLHGLIVVASSPAHRVDRRGNDARLTRTGRGTCAQTAAPETQPKAGGRRIRRSGANSLALVLAIACLWLFAPHVSASEARCDAARTAQDAIAAGRTVSLAGAALQGCELRGANLHGANLTGSRLDGAVLPEWCRPVIFLLGWCQPVPREVGRCKPLRRHPLWRNPARRGPEWRKLGQS